MTGILIRTATPADLDAVVGLLAAQLAEHGIGTPRQAIARAAHGSVEDAGGRGRILVAEGAAGAATAVLGVAVLSYQWTLEHGGRSAWLEELYVVPARRGRGIGRALLLAALEAAARDGAGAVDLEVAVGHERVETLYRREGFAPLPRTRWVRRLGAVPPR